MMINNIFHFVILFVLLIIVHSQWIEIWFDNMGQNNNWTCSNTNCNFGYTSSRCPNGETNSCHRIKGPETSAIRTTSISTYSALKFQFDVHANNIEIGDYCSIWTRYDITGNWNKIWEHRDNDMVLQNIIIDLPSPKGKLNIELSIRANAYNITKRPSLRCYYDGATFTGYVPTNNPTPVPTFNPTSVPTTHIPTYIPTSNPTFSPTINPTLIPTNNPTLAPTYIPTKYPTTSPSNYPTYPTHIPTLFPTLNPTETPTNNPTPATTIQPTRVPTYNTYYPTISTIYPSIFPTISPSLPFEATMQTAAERIEAELETQSIISSYRMYIIIVSACIIYICFQIGCLYYLSCKKKRIKTKHEVKIEMHMTNNNVKNDYDIGQIDTVERNANQMVQQIVNVNMEADVSRKSPMVNVDSSKTFMIGSESVIINNDSDDDDLVIGDDEDLMRQTLGGIMNDEFVVCGNDETPKNIILIDSI
eukprot:116621_1